jgi:hypothetical protein
MSDLDAKLAEVARQYDEIQADLSLPETSTDPAAIRRLGQELSRSNPSSRPSGAWRPPGRADRRARAARRLGCRRRDAP